MTYLEIGAGTESLDPIYDEELEALDESYADIAPIYATYDLDGTSDYL